MKEKIKIFSLRDEKIINVTSSRRYFFFTRAKFDANNGLFKENLVKYKGKRTSQDVMFIVFSSLIKAAEIELCLSIVNFQATQSSGKRLFTLYKIFWNKV